jgi:cell wall-associated NlpC family hydrolase
MNTSTAAAFGLPPLHDPTGILETHSRLINSSLIDAQVAPAMAPLKKEPNSNSETQTYVLKGEPLQILGEYSNWQLVVSVIDGYLGWLDQSAVQPRLSEPTHRVKVPLSHLYIKPDFRTQPNSILTMGAYVTVAGSTENEFLPIEGGGWLYARHLDVVGTYADDPITVAESFIGAPYLWGGRSALGIDCSGLVQVALASCGHRVHRDSGPQLTSLGRPLEAEESAARGDLAFFPGHVGWMLDNVHMLHANATNMAVTIEELDVVIERISKETDEPPFSGFRRL